MPEIHGFDLSPPLANTPEDRAKWERFLTKVKQHYCFWNSKDVQPKADHIFFNIGDGIKLPKDGTKFRTFASPCTKHNRWDVMPIIIVVWKNAMFVFGLDRAREFNSLIRPDGFLYKEGDQRSVYTAEEVARNLKGINSLITVHWSAYGPPPDEKGWGGLAVDAHNSWYSTAAKGDKKKASQEKEYFARFMMAKTKAWPETKALRLCHKFGTEKNDLSRLPVELIDEIEEKLVVLHGAPLSARAMTHQYDEERQAGVRKASEGATASKASF